MDVLPRARQLLGLLASLLLLVQDGLNTSTSSALKPNPGNGTDKAAFIDGLLDQMTVPDLGE